MKVAASPHSFLIPLFSLLPLEGGAPKGGGWLSKRDEVVGSTVFPVIPLLTSFLDRKRKRFLAFARNDDAGRRHTPSVLWKEVPRRGGGWELWCGNAPEVIWTGRDKNTLDMSKTHTVRRGQTYTLKVFFTVNGETTKLPPITTTCP